jgi:REP element-mobilizing transposase RayT
MSNPRAYLLTWTTYGTWLHGDTRGSVDDLHNIPETPAASTNPVRARSEQYRLVEAALILDEQSRKTVDAIIRRHCEIRIWPLIALNVRTNHVHCVVGWRDVAPERVMTELKTWSTRSLRALPSLGERRKFWTVHGSTRYLWDDQSVHDAARYVLFGQ